MTTQAVVRGLPEAVSVEAKRWACMFDFDSDSCYPDAAVGENGAMNGGLQDSGHKTGGCRDLDQLRNANTYVRSFTMTKFGVQYSVYMYALYFEKDQGMSGSPLIGHRHDWEYVLVWTTGGQMTHASFSSHGSVKTVARADLHFDPGKGESVKAVYHKDGPGTRCFRPAKRDERAENGLGVWVTPTLVEWSLMQSPFVANAQLQRQFNEFNYGDANCSFNDNNFAREISKNPPEGYPGPQEWAYAAGRIGPPLPEGLVTRWLLFLERDANRDNRDVPLLKGRQAQIVIHTADPLRSRIKFNLKHDKHNASDRGRTEQLGHGSIVSGDTEDWPNFGKRIYLGERQGLDVSGKPVVPEGIYVDLVLI